MRLAPSRLLAAAVIPLVLLASACGSGDDQSSAPNPLDTVSVGGAAKSPALTLKTKPFSVTKTESKVVTEGKGPVLSSGNSIGANYVLVNGKDGKQVESSFGKSVAAMDLDAKLLPGLRKGLLGKKVGSRVLVAMPPADAFGTAGNTQIGVGGSDTVLFLVDVISAKTPLTMAQGTAVAAKSGLPTVVMGKDLKTPAKVTVPKTDPPTSTVAQPLVVGKGAVIKSGQTLRVGYTGVIWKSGNQFDSSANTQDGYAQFPIGVGQVIPGWDKSLVGKTIGSRILLVVPPKDGYGSAGQAQAKISGTDTLVFVVDLLDAT